MAPPLAAGPGSSFEGAWESYPSCPAHVTKDPGKCSYFAITLYQRGGKLCGAHTYATPDAAKTDDGDAPSITGGIAGLLANA